MLTTLFLASLLSADVQKPELTLDPPAWAFAEMTYIKYEPTMPFVAEFADFLAEERIDAIMSSVDPFDHDESDPFEKR